MTSRPNDLQTEQVIERAASLPAWLRVRPAMMWKVPLRLAGRCILCPRSARARLLDLEKLTQTKHSKRPRSLARLRLRPPEITLVEWRPRVAPVAACDESGAEACGCLGYSTIVNCETTLMNGEKVAVRPNRSV